MDFDIEDYIRSNLDRAQPSASTHGSEFTANCPSCEKWGKFYINSKTGRFLCNSCGFRGNSIVGLVAHIEGLDQTQARLFVFKRSVTPRRKTDMFTLLDRIRALRPDAVEDEPEEVVDEPMPPGFVPVHDGTRWRLPLYLKDRKIKSETARAWALGHCQSGKYRDRLIIPIQCDAGNSWTARAMSKDHWGPKYLNPAGVDHRRLLIGWKQMKFSGDLVICEGPLDVVRLWQHGIAAVALGGKVVHAAQMAQLQSLPRSTSVIIMLDPEEETAPLDAGQMLSSHFSNIYVAKLPAGVDPGDSSRKQAMEAVEEARRWTGDRRDRLAAIMKASRARLSRPWA